MSPQIYIIIALACAIPVTYGAMWTRMQIATHTAYEKGKTVGAEQVAAKTTEQASNTVNAVNAGEAEAPAIPPERAAIIALCNKSASCRDRVKP